MKITVTRSLVVYAAWIVAFVLPTFVGAAGAPPLLTAEQSEALRKVTTVQLTISEDFGEAKATSVPEVREMLRLMIEASGLRIVEPTEKQSDARFEVTLQGAPLIQKDANGVARYTGATVQCRVQIRTGDVSYSQLIVGERKAWWGDDEGDKYREPEDAPLAMLMQETVFAEFPELLVRLFGSEQVQVIGAVFRGQSSMKVPAAIALGKLGEPAVEPLKLALGDAEPRVRVFAVDALEHIGGEKAAAALVTTFADQDEDVQRRAIEAAGRSGSPAALEALLAAFQSDSPKTRAAVVNGLSNCDDPRVMPILLRALQDDDHFVRFVATRPVAKIGSKAAPALKELLTDKRRETRAAVVDALSEMEDKARLEPLILALLDPDEKIVRSAHDGLTRYEDHTLKPLEPLLKVLAEGNLLPQSMAAMLLPDCNDPRAVDPLLAALKGELIELRPYAANALTRLKDARTVEPLLSAIDAADPLLRSQVALALGSQEDARAVEPLLLRLKDDDGDVRHSALLALCKIRDRRALAAVSGFMKNEDPRLRVQAAWSLGMIGGPEAFDSLLPGLHDSVDTVRQESASALGATGDPKAYDPLVSLLQDEDVLLVLHAVEGLGYLADQRAVKPLLRDSLHKRIAETDGVLAGKIREALERICANSRDPLIAAAKDSDSDIRANALWALNALDGDVRLEMFIDAVRDSSPDVRLKAAEILAYKKGDRDFAALLSLLDDQNSGVRRWTAFCLGERKDPRSFEPLLKALKDPAPAVRSFAVEALAKIGDKRAIAILVPLLEDPDGDVHYEVQQALQSLGDDE